jgi:inhibitor of KinA sporulation pathway (predicted exonuclease)
MDISTLRNTHKQIVVFDTEYTTWEGAMERDWSGLNEHRELVQLAAAMINLDEKEITSTLNLTVRPRINTQVSSYFSNLTHISQESVDTGLDFAHAYDAFMDWVQELPIFSYGQLGNELGDGLILQENINLYQLDVPFDEKQFYNVRTIFASAGIPTEKYNSGKLHQHFGITVPGHQHDALHDVVSLAASLFMLY